MHGSRSNDLAILQRTTGQLRPKREVTLIPSGASHGSPESYKIALSSLETRRDIADSFPPNFER